MAPLLPTDRWWRCPVCDELVARRYGNRTKGKCAAILLDRIRARR